MCWEYGELDGSSRRAASVDTEPRGAWALGGGFPAGVFVFKKTMSLLTFYLLRHFVLEAERRGADVLFCTLRLIKKLTSLTWGELDPPLPNPLPFPHTTGVKRASLPNTSASTSVLRAFVLAYLIKAGNAFYQTRENADGRIALSSFSEGSWSLHEHGIGEVPSFFAKSY